MTQRHFPDWIQAYLDYTEPLEAQGSFHFWGAVAAISGALEWKCYFDMGMFTYRPNFWIVFVGPAGIANKSTAIGVALSLLRKLKTVKFGPDSTTWQALTTSFIEAEKKIQFEGRAVKHSSLTLDISELGTLINPQNLEMVDVLVDFWDNKDNKPWTRRTQGGGLIEINNIYFNMIAGTTPSWIKGSMPSHAIGGGFTSRCIFIFSDKKRSWNAYPDEHMPSGHKEQYTKLLADLQQIHKLQGKFTLTREARDFGRKWYAQHGKMVESGTLDLSKWGGYYARKHAHIHKLAMVLSASAGNDLIITEPQLRMAEAMVTATEEHHSRVYENVADTDHERKVILLQQALLQMPEQTIPISTLYKQVAMRMPWQEFLTILDSQVRAGVVTKTQRDNKFFVTRLGPGRKSGTAEKAVRTFSQSAAPAPSAASRSSGS